MLTAMTAVVYYQEQYYLALAAVCSRHITHMLRRSTDLCVTATGYETCQGNTQVRERMNTGE
jgi:hypothetical protein